MDEGRLRELLATGVTRAAIAAELGIAPSTVSRHAHRLGFGAATRRPMRFDWKAIRAYYENGHSLSECRERFGFSMGAWDSAVSRGDVISRGRPRSQTTGRTRESVRQLLADGLSQGAIARELGISASTVSYHARKVGVPSDHRCSRRFDWAAIQRTYDEGASVQECQRLHGFSNAAWSDAVRTGRVVPRPRATPLASLLDAGRSRSRGNLKQRLIRAGLKESACELCGIDAWLGRPLSLCLHHVNGDGQDNRLENLQLLCPNCHSQTENFAGRNRRRDSRPGARVESTA